MWNRLRYLLAESIHPSIPNGKNIMVMMGQIASNYNNNNQRQQQLRWHLRLRLRLRRQRQCQQRGKILCKYSSGKNDNNIINYNNDTNNMVSPHQSPKNIVTNKDSYLDWWAGTKLAYSRRQRGLQYDEGKATVFALGAEMLLTYCTTRLYFEEEDCRKL